MNGSEVLDILREMCVLILKLSAPMLIAALIIGTVVSLIQAVTQIQEMTLTFVPKLIAVIIMGLWLLPLLSSSFLKFTYVLFSKITSTG
ncbi:MAG: flagellar biosynthetic protein FliQ [Proteobacteria bacterium]|nr:flagellar biosynthetic protein FliQ [Pseudomonadota bacterium]